MFAPSSKRALTFIFFTILLDILGAGILMPVVPYLVRPYSADALTIGLMAATYSIAQFFASPVLGALSDRLGRRPVLVLSVFGTAIGYVIFGIGGALWVFFVSRVIDGFTGGNFTTAQAYIADVSKPEDRAKNFGLIGAAFGLGFILGPAIGGGLAKISLTAPAWAAAGVAFCVALLGWFALPESLPPERRRPHPLHLGDFNPISAIGKAMNTPKRRALFGGAFLVRFAHMALQTNFAVYVLKRFQATPSQSASVFAVLGATAAIMQGFIVRKLHGKMSDSVMLLGGTAIIVLGMALLAWAPVWGMVMPSIVVLAIGGGLMNPSMQSFIAHAGPQEEQGILFGANGSITALTTIAGPAFAGLMSDHVGLSAPFWAAALIDIVALVYLRRAVTE